MKKTTIITFGQYQGQAWSTLPKSYLKWISETFTDETILDKANHWLLEEDARGKNDRKEEEEERLRKLVASGSKEVEMCVMDGKVIVHYKDLENELEGLNAPEAALAIIEALGEDIATKAAREIIYMLSVDCSGL